MRFMLGVMLVVGAVFASTAAAEPASGPRETIDQTYTATTPRTATGLGFAGRYHAPGDPNGNPPYMRKMVFYPPAGFRFDTSVPDRCTASDAQLSLQGKEACPPGSVVGDGTAESIFWAPVTHAFVFDHSTRHLDIVNNTNEQVMLIESVGFTVVRGKVQPDGSIEFAGPTCFPSPPPGVPCADDYLMQLASITKIPLYTKTIAGKRRSYATTPRTCPPSGRWATHVRFWWSDGSIDDVVTTQPCS
jgi:hypothetical protein